LCFRDYGSITWDFLRLFIDPQSRLRYCTGVQKLLIKINAENPTFYYIIDNCVRKWRELRVLILFKQNGQFDESLEMEARVMEYLVEALSKEAHTKSWEMVRKQVLQDQWDLGTIAVSMWTRLNDAVVEGRYDRMWYEVVGPP